MNPPYRSEQNRISPGDLQKDSYIRVAELRIDFQAKLRQLDGEVGIQSMALDGLENGLTPFDSPDRFLLGETFSPRMSIDAIQCLLLRLFTRRTASSSFSPRDSAWQKVLPGSWAGVA